MSEHATLEAYGELIAPATLKIQRLLPGPVERVWAYLTESELRRTWLAAGEMEMRVGAAFEFVWRNDELTDPPGRKPEDFGEEHRMRCTITELDPPRKLAITWGEKGGVSFELQPQGDDVLLTLVHQRISDHKGLLDVSSGWHGHLDILVARLTGTAPSEPFWDRWLQLRAEYEHRLPV